MVAKKVDLWTTGQLIRVRFENGSMPLQEFVRSNLIDVLQHANLRFMWMHYNPHNQNYTSRPSAEIRIDFDHGDGDPRWDYLIACAIGTRCYAYEESRPTMHVNAVKTAFRKAEGIDKEIADRRMTGAAFVNPEHKDRSTEYLINYLKPYYFDSVAVQVRHEALHLLGFIHEQHHPDSRIAWKPNFDLNLKRAEVIATEYDTKSLAHYPTEQYKDSVLPGTVLKDIPYNDKLSELDFIGMKMLYPFEIPVHQTLSSDWEGFVSLPNQPTKEINYSRGVQS